ncbi:chemotaxis regulatory protein ChePep isoform X2 [Palaemon carinicauda]|uniref:chemotaxis regulatory protein ChePep isoform X2 n=1 Tax=Palaemon carinicauda TaxID=392227 RepID=UPI0035B60694
MGCGTSKAVPVVLDQDAVENLKEAHLISDAQEGLTCIDTPDKVSEAVGSQESSPSLHSVKTNGIEPALPQANGEVLPEVGEEEVKEEEKEEEEEEEREEEKEDLADLPRSAGGRAVAFEVATPEEEGDSLIKRHPPKKFQRLEDQQQQASELTQELLEEKQVEAERRRQEILSQRVQSAKQRTARSAGRMRTRPDDGDDVEQLEGGMIESADTITTENEL